jgi:hypothetical protein
MAMETTSGVNLERDQEERAEGSVGTRKAPPSGRAWRDKVPQWRMVARHPQPVTQGVMYDGKLGIRGIAREVAAGDRG